MNIDNSQALVLAATISTNKRHNSLVIKRHHSWNKTRIMWVSSGCDVNLAFQESGCDDIGTFLSHLSWIKTKLNWDMLGDLSWVFYIWEKELYTEFFHLYWYYFRVERQRSVSCSLPVSIGPVAYKTLGREIHSTRQYCCMCMWALNVSCQNWRWCVQGLYIIYRPWCVASNCDVWFVSSVDFRGINIY